MALIDFIWNLACLLLWLNWRSISFDPLDKRKPATLIGTLRQAEPQRQHRWQSLAVLAGLLLLRAGIYWQIGSANKPAWSGTLDLGVVVPHFASNSFVRMMLFSCFSFGLMLGVFYLWLLLLSLLAGPEPPRFHRLVRMQLGRIDRWPNWLKWVLPLLFTASFWWLASWLLAWTQIIPPCVSPAHRLEESLVIGLNSYLAWRYIAAALLALHLLNSYIYFGKHPIWAYVNTTARTLLSPLRALPLRLGKADFAPVVGIVVIFLFAQFARNGIHTRWFYIPGLIDIYGRLPL
jgi:uncharacterized protein YggT (Ycf19 family)